MDNEKKQTAAPVEKAEPAKKPEAAPEVKMEKEESKKETWAIVLGIIALVFLGGTKLIFGSLFFYVAALIFGLIALWFAMKPKDMTKKAIMALVIALTPVTIAGYNLVGIAARDAIIDITYHRIENEVRRDVRDITNIGPETEEDLKRMDEKFKQDVKEFDQRVKEDAAKEEAAK